MIAFDEGFYALQARWILDRGDWITPMWWGAISLDRTIGIQYLIALSQKFFGENVYSIFIPTTFAACLFLYFTYDLHKELIGDKKAIFSPLILGTTFLWINYSHLATQDIVFSSIVTSGILFSIKAAKTKKNKYLFLAGLWIGLGVFFKTYLVLIPLVAILPYLYSSRILSKKTFWIGVLLGFLPFILWSYEIIIRYGFPVYTGLFDKLLILSKNNNFTNPFYYYLWNLPLNVFPWSIFSIVGLILSFKELNYKKKYFLFFYPIIIITLLSFFSTKTPYYPIQILSLLSLDAYLGIIYLINNHDFNIKFIRRIIFIFLPSLLLIFLVFANYVDQDILNDQYQKVYLNIGLTFFILSWFGCNFVSNNKRKLILIILGPYLLTSLLVQSGMLTDRSKSLRIALEKIILDERISSKEVQVVTSELGGESANSKIIRISLMMPNLGKGIKFLDELKIDNYAWTTKSRYEINSTKKYKIISEASEFKPWSLILRE